MLGSWLYVYNRIFPFLILLEQNTQQNKLYGKTKKKTISKGQSGAEALATSTQRFKQFKVTSLDEIDKLIVSEVRQYHLTRISKHRLSKLLQNDPDYDKVKRQVIREQYERWSKNHREAEKRPR